jgi:outer membrane protein assembly factor BamB
MVDDALAQTIRRIKSLDHVPTPQSFRMKQIKESVMNATTFDMTSFGSVIPASTPLPTNGNRGIQPAASRPVRHRWQFASLAIAVALLALSGLGIFLSRDEGPPAVIPAVQDTPTAADWPNFRGTPGRTGMVSGTPFQTEPGVLWQTDVGGRIENPSVVAEGMVYVPSGGPNGLVALDAHSGREVWHVADIGGVPAVGDGVVIVRSGSADQSGGDLIALDATSGAELWRHAQTQDAGWTPVIDQGVVYIPALPSAMQALDLNSGETIWSTELPGAVTKSASLSDAMVIFGNTDGNLYALSRDDGQIIWTASLTGGVIGVPAIDSGRIYVSVREGGDPGLHALDLPSGKELWSNSGSGADIRYAAASGGSVYLPSLDGTLTALNASDGTQKWQLATGGPISGSPVIAGDMIYQASEDGQLYAVDGESGATVWTFALDGPSSVETPVAENAIYVLTQTGTVYALSETASAAVADATPVATPEKSGAAAHIWTLTGAAEPFGDVPLATIDPQGRIWVADPHTNQIQIFDLDGTFLESWGEPGSGPGQFDFVRDNGQGIGNVDFDSDGNIYVSEGGNRRIQKFDKDRSFVTMWGSNGTDGGQFLSPFVMRISPNGNVYVMDDFRGDIQVFDPDGTFLYKFGDPWTTDGAVTDITAFEFDASGNVYAVEDDNQIQVFDERGAYLQTIVAPGTGGLNVPVDLAFDPQGNIYVVNIASNDVAVFDPDGTLLLSWGSFGTEDGQFNEPVRIMVRGEYVYVVEATGKRIQKFQVTLPGT